MFERKFCSLHELFYVTFDYNHENLVLQSIFFDDFIFYITIAIVKKSDENILADKGQYINIAIVKYSN